MPTLLPNDEVLLEKTLRTRIKAILDTVPSIQNVYDRQRFPEDDTEDVALTTWPDPITGFPRIFIVDIGIPVVTEHEYTGDESTQLDFVYPISCDVEVVDLWNKVGIEFNNSQELATAIYMRARRKFKFNRTLGFDNCVHDYLQQVSAVVIDVEETSGQVHSLDWSLTVKVTGVLV